MPANASVSFALWLHKPLQIAADNPSGHRLADAIAAQVDLLRPGSVLELGAGTGSLTRGLIRAGCPPERIVALERDWVESCSALVEQFDGRLELVRWMTHRPFDPLGIEAAFEIDPAEEVFETVEERV